MYYSFDALNCCVVCALFFSVVGFFVTTHWFGLEGHFNHNFIFCIATYTFSLAYYFLCFLLGCITSSFNTGMHFYINWFSVILWGLFWSSCQIHFLYSSVGTLLCWWFLPWDLLDWFSLWICCLLCSVYCLWHLLFIYLFHVYLSYFFNLLNLSLWYCSSLGISWAWSFQL